MVSKRMSDEHNEHAREAAALIVPKPRGRSVAISDEDIEHALDRLANGDTMRNITADLGVTRSALLKRANVDDEFGKMMRIAMEIGTFAMLENAQNAIMGGECSTGDIRRDKEIADFAKWYAARMGRRIWGDRLTVDHASVVVNLPDRAGDV